MQRILLIPILLMPALWGMAADIRFPASSISPELLKGANVVKRMERAEFHVVNEGETIYRREFALTILNEAGAEHAGLVEFYDRFQQVRSIEGALYDANGVLLKKLKQKEILDLGASDGNNLADDNRKKTHRFYHKTYPYTIYYEVETRSGNTLFFPVWMPQEDECFAVEQSSFTIISPDGNPVRYRVFNYKEEPVVSSLKGRSSMTWQVKELVALKRPFASPPWSSLTTTIMFAPGRFQIGNYKGDMSSWNGLGEFIYSLKKGRTQLPAHVEQKVKELLEGVESHKEKISILYQYLQKHTRYISIQLGLGGWQPFEASFVAEKGWGDCKALTNYMSSLLQVAGIPSFEALVKAGRNQLPVIEDFPSQQFNHVILCVPVDKDTVWLECTSQTLAAGYLGEFSSNRKALLIDENGAMLVSTPRYGANENLEKRNIQARIDDNGDLQMKVQTSYDALKGDALHSMVHSLSPLQLEKILEQQPGLPSLDIVHMNYDFETVFIPRVKESYEAVVKNYAAISGKRIFFHPNILNRSQDQIENGTNRSSELIIDDGFTEEDDYEIEIPPGYTIESLPADTRLTNNFGTYHSTTTVEGNKILYRRVKMQHAGIFPAASQQELSEFFQAVYRSDRERVVMIKM